MVVAWSLFKVLVFVLQTSVVVTLSHVLIVVSSVADDDMSVDDVMYTSAFRMEALEPFSFASP